MKLIALLCLAVAVSATGEQRELILLPIAPSVTHCGYNSRYDTRLLAYNHAEVPGRLCVTDCTELGAKRAVELEGEHAGDLPLPLFLSVPTRDISSLHLSLVIESSQRDHPEQRSFTEIPVVRASDFRSGMTTFMGVRMDPDFRQTVRIFGLDPKAHAQLLMRVFSLDSSELLHECIHDLWPLPDDGHLRPSFGMECDMSEHIPADGQKVRIEIAPVTPGLKYWTFMSITNNVTQHFYTVLPSEPHRAP